MKTLAVKLIASLMVSAVPLIVSAESPLPSPAPQSWDWNDKSLGFWEAHPDKKDLVTLTLKTENEKETRLEVGTPGGWCPAIVVKNIFLDGAKKISVDVNPGNDFEWIKLQPVLQSSAKEWDPLAEKEVKKGDKWQTLVFELDSSAHKNSGWNQIVLVFNSDKKGKVLVDNVKILK